MWFLYFAPAGGAYKQINRYKSNALRPRISGPGRALPLIVISADFLLRLRC
jgi:hypothetical protein